MTDEDMNDPELLAQLKAMGYNDDEVGVKKPVKKSLADKIEAKEKELVKAKRKALALKKAKRMDECVQMIRDIVKPLKAEIEMLKTEQKLKKQDEVKDDDEEEVTVTEEDMNDPELLAQLKAMNGGEEEEHEKKLSLAEQIEAKEKELVEAKRKALALKKAKRMDECVQMIRDIVKPLKAEIEMLKTEQKLKKQDEVKDDDEEEVTVTEEDMNDPELLAQLKAMNGGEEEENEKKLSLAEQIEAKEKEIVEAKRKALALKKAKRMDECVQMIRDIVKPLKAEIEMLKTEQKLKKQDEVKDDDEVTEEDMNDPELLAQLQTMNDSQGENEKKLSLAEQIEAKEKELVEAKRKALALKKAKRMDECVQMIRDIVKPLKAEIEMLKKSKDGEKKEMTMSPDEKRLYAFYQYWEPSRLKDMDFLKRTIKRYENKIPQLFSDLGKKYGPEPSQLVSLLKDREADYLKEAMRFRKSGDKKECQVVLAEADKLRSGRESVEAGTKIDLKSLPEDMSARRIKSNAAKRKRTIARIKSLLALEIKRTKIKTEELR